MSTEKIKPYIPPGPKAKWLVFGVAFLMVLVPFLFWKGTWFGTVLSDQKLKNYLERSARPRDTQHALLQLSEQMTRGQWEQARRWYPSILTLITHPVPEVRNTLAWVMGQDTTQAQFHQALAVAKMPIPWFAETRPWPWSDLPMSRDVPNCSACSGRLPWFRLEAGVLRYRLKEDDSVDTGTLLGRIETGAAEPFEGAFTIAGLRQG